MNKISFAAAVSTLAFVAATAFAQTAKSTNDAAKSVNDGVYTAAQADRGAAVFKTTCTACHDTARFTGSDFLSAWVGKPLHDLYDVVHTTMPENKPGSLTTQQYADVVAYFLRLNGYPAGKTELPPTPAALKTIKFDKKKAAK